MHKPTGNRAGMHAGSGIGLAVASMTTVQLGYGLSEPLFDRIGAAGTVALRLALAALILWPFARPRLRGRSRTDLGAAVALGACSGLLTLAFSESISRIPLGVAVTIEFLGPLGVALAGSRRPRDVGWVLAAGGGIALLTLGDGAGEPLDAVGIAFALVSAVCWAGYILLTKRVGARWAGLEGLSVSLVVAALVALPAGITGAGGELLSLELIAVGIGLALLVLLPYVFELIALRRLPTALFGVIMSLEPAIAALLGFLILDQELKTTGIVAIAMVSIASAGATLSSREPPVNEEAPAPSARHVARRPAVETDPGLRASDADREQVVSRLREHAADGRLDVAELEQRIDPRTRRGRTGNWTTANPGLPAANSATGPADHGRCKASTEAPVSSITRDRTPVESAAT